MICGVNPCSFNPASDIHSNCSCFETAFIHSTYIPFMIYHVHITKNFLCITHTVEHNYISPSSTVGIQLHVSALYVGHLQVVI